MITRKPPTALQSPAAPHDTEPSTGAGFGPKLAGNVGEIAGPHVPADSVHNIPKPTALQFPGDEHDTELRPAGWFKPGFASTTAGAHVSANDSDENEANTNSTAAPNSPIQQRVPSDLITRLLLLCLQNQKRAQPPESCGIA